MRIAERKRCPNCGKRHYSENDYYCPECSARFREYGMCDRIDIHGILSKTNNTEKDDRTTQQ